MKYPVSFDLELRRHNHPGRYIAVEGIDASGKTTQVDRLAEKFQKDGKEVIVVKEPWDEGMVGKLVREILRGEVKVPSVSLQYLYVADRAILYKTITEPALKEGKVVISSRCFWSAVPYGIMDRSAGQYNTDSGDFLLVSLGISSLYHQFVTPDQTFFLDISVDTAMDRLQHAHRGHELYEKRNKLEKIQRGYQWMLTKFTDEFILIDGEQPVERVTEDIVSRIKNHESGITGR